jgi:putative ABC transport system permease protein
VLTGRVTLPVASYPSDSVRVAFFEQLLPNLAALPGVVSVGATASPPLSNGSWTVSITREDHASEDVENARPRTFFSPTTPGLFATIGVPLIEGRDFTTADRLGAAPVAIVNQSAARRLWPDQDAVGRRLKAGQDSVWRTVVGVVGDVRQMAKQERRREVVYVPHAQNGAQSLTFMLRADGDPTSLTPRIRRLLQARDANLPFYDVRTMRAALAYALWEPRLYAQLLGAFSLVALGIAAVGLYGVMAYRVAQRTREIGIRMALGAERRTVLRMVIGDGMRLTVFGLGIGLAVAFALTRLMASLLFGVSASDPPTYAGVVVILAGSALLACWLPAARASRVDPMVALRHE